MASLLDWFGNQAKGVVAQVNPWDNGATYASVQRAAADEERRRRQAQQAAQQAQQARLTPQARQNIARADAGVRKAQANIWNPGAIAGDVLKASTDFGKNLVSGLQQSAGNLGDVALMGGNVIGNAATNVNPFLSEAQKNQVRQQDFNNTEQLRNAIKGAKTVTGQSYNPNKDYVPSGNTARDIADLTGRGIQTGLNATTFVNPGRALSAGMAKSATAGQIAKQVVKEASLYGGTAGTATGATTYAQTGDPNEAVAQGLKNAIETGATQGILSGGGYVVGRGIHAAPQAAETATNIANAPVARIAAQDPRVAGFNDHINQLQQTFDNTPDPVVRQKISKAISQAHIEQGVVHKRVMREMAQGGYHRIPGASNPEEIQGLIQNEKDFLTSPNLSQGTIRTSEKKIADLERQLKAATGLPQAAADRTGHTASDLRKTDKAQRIQSVESGQPSKPQAIASKEQTLSPSLPDSIPLPTYKSKKVSALDKAFRSTRSIIERQGESGQRLAAGLQHARDTHELFLSELQQKMPSVTKLARKGRNSITNKDFENFVDTTQGLAKPKNVLVEKAVKEWQATHPQIRDRAIKAGLEVGDLGPKYYPHFVDYDRLFKDKNTYNEAINHLVQSGQAKSHEDAIKLLSYAKDVSRNREFGSLEASRLVDLPFYDKTPNSFTAYLNGSTKRIANTETFGAKDEKALKLITKIGHEGGDTEAAKNAFDIAVGAKNYGDTPEAISRGIRKYITTTRLGLGAITNTSQSVNTGIVTGHFRTLGAMFKQLNPETRKFVADTGVISDALLNDLRTQKGVESFSSKVLGKAINKITAPGFGSVEKFNRSVAATAGRDYALRLAQKGDIKTLKGKLGVTGEIRNKTLTTAQQVQAARKIVEKTQFKVDPQDLPGWVDSPGGKLVAQFRTFSYSQGKFFSNEILKPTAHGDFMPLARLAAALPLGYGLYELRRNIDARPEDDNKVKVGIESFSKIGGAGLAFDIYKSINPIGGKYIPADRRTAMATGAIGGPAVGLGTQAIGAISEGIQKKSIPKTNPTLEGKAAIRSGKGKDEGYNDLTSLSRFGIQQIPIAGTAIANRVLPYKKQSDADTKGSAAINKLTPQQKVMVNTALDGRKEDLIKQYTAENTKKSATDKAAVTRTEKSLNPKTSANSKHLLTKFAKTEDREKWFAEKPNAEFEYYKAKYENDKANGEITPIEDVKRRRTLKKDEVGSTFSKTTRDTYSHSKADILAFISTDKNGKRIAEELSAYDRALYDAGLTKYLKFKNGFEVAKGGGKSSGKKKGGRGGSRSRGVASGKSLNSLLSSVEKIKTPKTAADTKAATKPSKPQMKKVALKKYAVKNQSVARAPIKITARPA